MGRGRQWWSGWRFGMAMGGVLVAVVTAVGHLLQEAVSRG